MYKKSLAIILSIALAVGILVHGSFAYTYDSSGTEYSFDDLWALGVPQSSSFLTTYNAAYDFLKNSITADSEMFLSVNTWNVTFHGLIIYCSESGYFRFYNNRLYLSEPNTHVYFVNGATNQSYNQGTMVSNTAGTIIGNHVYYLVTSYVNVSDLNASALYSSSEIYYFNDFLTPKNLALGSLNPDTRFLEAYKSMSTYSRVPFLCIQADDMPWFSSYVSVRYLDSHGTGTYIYDRSEWGKTTIDGSYVLIQLDPNLISKDRFEVTSVLYSGSTEWGVKEIDNLGIVFNEDVLPSPIPSVVPVSDYSYYDTTYINYNGGSTDIIYTPISCDLEIGYLGGDSSKNYFRDFPGFYIEQPFSYSFIVIPDIPYEYSSFLEDCIYQYDVVIDDFENVLNNNFSSFEYIYGSGSWSDLYSVLTAAQTPDVSSVLETWYSTHDPIIYQYPFGTSDSFNILGSYSCSLIVTDSFYFKQTNYLLGDTGNILSELSERLFKVDGFSDALFQNMSSLYNLNLQYYESSLDALTGLSYWLNDNDISSNLSDIGVLLTSVNDYLSSVDGKLNYLVTIDSDLNDLLEWFQNQEDSDVTLTIPDFNPSLLINIYGENIGDFVGFVQDFVNTLPEFDFSDFPNFFDYAADLVDDTAGSGDDLIGSLFQPYDYDDSGLHDFGWD